MDLENAKFEYDIPNPGDVAVVLSDGAKGVAKSMVGAVINAQEKQVDTHQKAINFAIAGFVFSSDRRSGVL